MSRLAELARTKLVGDRPNDWQTYHRLVADTLRPGMRVLDIGCGVGNIAPFSWQDHPGVELFGIDPNPDAERNANLHRFELLTDFGHWPVEDSSVDLAIARYVLEHVEQPDEFFANLDRVLKPGGRFIALTPNRFHPAVMVSGMLPLRAKQRILKSTADIDDSDVFATWYRLNTTRQLRRYAQKFGLQVERLEAREFVPNDYLNFNVLGFFMSYTYYQAVRWTYCERWFGMAIDLIFRKQP
jgi:SAM-dependent methyltransferase